MALQMKVFLDSLPEMVIFEIQHCYDSFEERAETLAGRLRDLLGGMRKKQVVDWWLSYIEVQTDDFLQGQGFVMDALPYNYLDVPPDDLAIISSNLSLVRELMSLSGREPNPLDEFLDITTAQVYSVLDRLIAEFEFALRLKEHDEELKYLGLVVTDRQMAAIRSDYEYLMTMKTMDNQIKEKRRKRQEADAGSENTSELEVRKLEMTHVVPVGGLVMARIHILECELDSAEIRWKGRPIGFKFMAQKEKKGSTVKVNDRSKQIHSLPPDLESVRAVSFASLASLSKRKSPRVPLVPSESDTALVNPKTDEEKEQPTPDSPIRLLKKSQSNYDIQSLGMSQACIAFALNRSTVGTFTPKRIDRKVLVGLKSFFETDEKSWMDQNVENEGEVYENEGKEELGN
jgi:hypothetical protein